MPETFVILGDGIAGATAAENLRSRSPDSTIVVITNEGEPLYNRVTIKDFAKGSIPEEKAKIHDLKWYKDRNIDLRLYTQVRNLDDRANTIVCEDGSRVEYTKCLVATGGVPRRYSAPGANAANILNFWTFVDARRIRAAAEGGDNAVVIGAGLLGIDLAVIFAKHGLEPRYIMRGNRWWREGLNKEGSQIVEGLLEKMGVVNVFGETVTEFKLEGDKAVAAVTDKGTTYPMDVAGVAIGLSMNMRYLMASNIKTGEGVLTNEYMQTSVPNVFAAGDITQYFDPILNRININGSWASAKAQGKIAALNMLEPDEKKWTPFEHVDFYSIDHFDVPVMSVGNILGDEISEGIVEEGVYRRMVFKDGRLIGAVMVGDAKPLPFMKKIIGARVVCNGEKQEMLKAAYDFKGLAAKAAAPKAA